MTITTIRSRIVQCMGQDAPDHTKLEHIGIDSLDRVDLIIALQDVFGIEITDQDDERLNTIGDVVSLVTSKIASATA